MGVHPFPMSEFQAEDMTEARREMWQWAEPVIADCAADCYDRALPNRLASNIMARKHCRLWQAVIHDQPEALPALKDDLRRTGAKFGLEIGVQHDINTVLFEELIDIVLARYRNSRRTTKAFSMVLMSANTSLGAIQAVA